MAGVTSPVHMFLGRLTRLDPDALVRVREAELWARVPWNVLVTRTVAGLSSNRTVSAAAWLAHGGDDPSGLPNLDDQWRTGLPPATGVVVETVPTRILRRVSTAAAETLRETATGGLNGRAVGARAIRDALLDHVPIVVVADAGMSEIRVPQRLVQAVARMHFLGSDSDLTEIIAAGPWVGISTGNGGAWWRAASALALHPHRA
jgi:hypothetical protein